MVSGGFGWFAVLVVMGCYQDVVPPEGYVWKNNSWLENWTPPLTEAVVWSILKKRCAEKFCKVYKKTPVLEFL